MMADAKNIALTDYAARRGMRAEEIADVFTNVAASYDDIVESMNYKDHVYVAEGVANYYSRQDKTNIKILDVAAGTGMLADVLWKKGFRNIDGLDPSEGMKREAMKKNLYTNFYLEYMDGTPIPTLKSDTYDCLVVAAAFNTGLLPCASLKEMARLVKSNGLVCFGIPDARFTEVEEYIDRLQPLMLSMEENGSWKLLDKTHYNEFYDNSGPGTVYRYVVKASDMDTNIV